jgi:outer membrane biosynthesis protein TonB
MATREAAVAIARKARFTPLMNNGVPIVSTTILPIEFVAPKPKASSKPPDNTRYTIIGTTDPPKGIETVPSKVTEAAPPDTDKPTTYTGPVLDAKPRTSMATPTGSTKAPTGNGDEKILPGGVLNGKAISLPKPAYPRAALAVHATGAVQVQVLIDEDGRVFSAAATGHPLLQHASAQAACGSRFTPTLLSGEPVKVSGIIVYNFVP